MRHAAVARPADAGANLAARDRRRRLWPPRLRTLGRRAVDVLQALGRTAVAFELRFDPIDGGAVAVGALAAVTESRQLLDRRLVPIEREPANERLHEVIWLRR